MTSRRRGSLTDMITKLNTVAVPVTDQDKALEFYVGTLGMAKRRDDVFGPGLRWIEVAPAGAVTSVALAPATMGGGQVGVDTGIRFATTDAGAEHADLAGKGVDVDDVLRWEGVPPMFSFRDPDGNALYMVEID
jgi:catechol 2,3-dioxygenase-like lactoylglutathione lyase family enzyme